MNLSVIIPYCKGDSLRDRGLHRLGWCIQDQLWDNCEKVRFELLVSDDVVTNGLPWNKSSCINRGVKKAQYNNLLILDADIRFGTDYFQKVIEFAKDKEFFMGYNQVRYDRGLDNMHQRVMEIKDVTACALSFFINKDLFWDVGGGNEKYYGHGNEDNDLYARIKHRLGFEGIAPHLPYEIEHTYHHWHRPDSSYPLNKDRVKLFEETKKDIEGEIQRLKERRI